jgi:hypothetical protein
MSNNTFFIDKEHVSCLTTEESNNECAEMRHGGSKSLYFGRHTKHLFTLDRQNTNMAEKPKESFSM